MMAKKRPGRHNNPWTSQDVAALRDMYRKKVVHRAIAAKLGRTLNAVESKATELRLTRKRRQARRR
jgi:hypothetical protein